MRNSSLGRLILATRHPPLWARWLLTIFAFAVATLAVVVFVHDHSEGTSAPTKSEREAEVEANREGNVVIEEDQAPHTARLDAGVATLTALERSISGDARGRIQAGNLTGPFQSVHCEAKGAANASRAFRCTVHAAGVAYPYLAVLDEHTRQFTWCKVDPPPVSGAPEVPVSPRCRP
ncbi:MAG TPA: hypothetical protein VK730_00270 [Solirubrobacteraceae bacterium]|jgi:hypothetical protein|nr:hypothetical protein [Solirubrobacteraceae bacterium]